MFGFQIVLNMARKTIQFQRVVWAKDKISIPEAKTLAFKNLPSPNTPKKARSVICALSYYRIFRTQMVGILDMFVP